jgi:hypothetical protein
MTMITNSSSVPLISANYTILSGAKPDTLKTTLQEICETARTITEADWVIVYPLVEGTQVFDIQNISYAGNINVPLESVVKAKPRKSGVSAHGGSSRVDLQACKLGTGRRFTTS